MPEEQFLRIKDRTFEIESSLIAGYVFDDGMIWNIDVVAKPKIYEEDEWSPRAYLEGIPWEIRSIEDIDTTPIIVPDGETLGDGTILPDSTLCCLCVFEHYFMRESTTRIKRVMGNQFLIEWTAECDLFWNDEYDIDLPLELRANTKFLGIDTLVREEAPARELLSQYFDDSTMIFDPAPQYDMSSFKIRD